MCVQPNVKFFISLTFFLADLFLTTSPNPQNAKNIQFETWVNKVRERNLKNHSVKADKFKIRVI